MSKEEKCTLSDSELIDRSNEWVSKLAKSGGKAWTLRIPVDFNYDPDMLFVELGKRLTDTSSQLAAYKDTLREFIEIEERIFGLREPTFVSESEVLELITKAKTLIE